MVTVSGNNHSFLIVFLLIFVFTSFAYEILYTDEFQTNRISENWSYYGDPISIISTDQGNPLPSFNNNGDSMGSSGIKSVFRFPIEEGICLQADIFLKCHPRGTWIGIDGGFYNIDSDYGNTNLDMMPNPLVYFNISYDGELAWQCPHIETTLGLHCKLPNLQTERIIHANQFLGVWLKFTLEFLPEKCNLLVNDSLVFSFETTLPDSITEAGVFIGGRATSWGTALVDNLIIYRP